MSSAGHAVPDWSRLQTDAGWQHTHTTTDAVLGEVKIYRRDIDGVPCFQGQASAAVSVQKLLDVVVDFDTSAAWSSTGLAEGVLLSRSGDVVDYYQRLDAPLISDRFWFLRGHIEQSSTSAVFWWERLEGGGPYTARYQQVRTEHPRAIELPINVGAWTFTDQGEQVALRYFVCSDPGGSIPDALQILGTEGALPDNMRDLVVEAQRRP